MSKISFGAFVTSRLAQDGYDIVRTLGSFEVLRDANGKYYVGARSGGPLPGGKTKDGPYPTEQAALKQAQDLHEDYD